MAANLYEFTPLKQHFTPGMPEGASAPDSRMAPSRIGSSIGLMLMLVALSVMSVAWMSVIAVNRRAKDLCPHGRNRLTARARDRRRLVKIVASTLAPCTSSSPLGDVNSRGRSG